MRPLNYARWRWCLGEDTSYKYLLLYNKNIRIDFDDELKLGDVRYHNMA